MTGIQALLAFAAWTLLLPMIYAGYRTLLVLTGKSRADAWTRGKTTNDPEFITRTSHAHMNCVENLPVFAAVVLASVALGQAAVVDALACVFIAARIAQSVTHMIAVNHWMVFLRANFFFVQVGLIFYWVWKLCCAVAPVANV
ncbi:MAG: MAPEG family protein [Pseudomonadota bacterium]